MIIIGVDYHPSDQYIAFVDTETGEYGERIKIGATEAIEQARSLLGRSTVMDHNLELPAGKIRK
jgi:hypothetical protein